MDEDHSLFFFGLEPNAIVDEDGFGSLLGGMSGVLNLQMGRKIRNSSGESGLQARPPFFFHLQQHRLITAFVASKLRALREKTLHSLISSLNFSSPAHLLSDVQILPSN